jgi:hypothetical protein
MSENAKKKVHAVVSGVLKENVPLNAANEEVSELSTVHNLETLRERSPSVSPIPTYSASPVVAGTLGLGHTTTEALGGGAMQQHFPVGMGLGFSAEEYSQNNSNNDDLLVAIRRSQAALNQQQQQGKRKSRRSRRAHRRSRKTYRRSRRTHRR